MLILRQLELEKRERERRRKKNSAIDIDEPTFARWSKRIEKGERDRRLKEREEELARQKEQVRIPTDAI